MLLFWLFFCFNYNQIEANELKLITKTHSSFLEKYEYYMNVVIVHLVVPQDTKFASFKFTAEETDFSIFGCKPRNVSIYMKWSTLPLANPDNSKIPDNFKNITRVDSRNLEFLSDLKAGYLNITNPEPGSYYIATFLAYADPKYDAIQQQGLSPNCGASVDVNLFVRTVDAETIVEEKSFIIEGKRKHYKIYIGDFKAAVLKLYNKQGINGTVRVEKGRIPSSNSSIIKFVERNMEIPFPVTENSWYYLQFISMNSTTLNVRLLKLGNVIGERLTDVIPYKEINLYRDGNTDSFMFSFEMPNNTSVPNYAVNITNREVSLMKFHLNDVSDIGGTLQFIIAFKPRITRSTRGLRLEDEPKSHTVIGCISQGVVSRPSWPNHCITPKSEIAAPLVINGTVDNATIYVPYPESGTWYATFKLFCGDCKTCDCPSDCQLNFRACLDDCLIICDNCTTCASDCRKEVIKNKGCDGCDCDGACLKEKEECNSSVLFDLSSWACVHGNCGKNGRCMFMVSDGVVFSSCMCSNNYRGWDCSDDSFAHPYWLVVLELLLLVLSNLMFLPTVYVAYKRKYYVESLVYFSICFFSTFYHSCDAGENIISMCITRIAALQFADFFCALLAIWVTLIAIADFKGKWPHLLHVIGAIILSFCTTINKTSLWVFALPALSGLVIISASWYCKYRKVKQLFANKNYLYFNVPIGSVIVVTGLGIFALLQTEDNYKYLHSMWHVIMAVAVIILLPKSNTFQPETSL